VYRQCYVLVCCGTNSNSRWRDRVRAKHDNVLLGNNTARRARPIMLVMVEAKPRTPVLRGVNEGLSNHVSNVTNTLRHQSETVAQIARLLVFNMDLNKFSESNNWSNRSITQSIASASVNCGNCKSFETNSKALATEWLRACTASLT